MENPRLGKAALSGIGRLVGGRYESVSVSGSGVIDGDIEAETVKTSGSAKFRGDVASRSVETSGSAAFKGNVNTDEFTISGSSEVVGHLHARKAVTSGSLVCKDAIRAEEVKISGYLKVENDVETEFFKASGSFSIGGLLNASQIKVSMNGRCKVQEMGGDMISVKIAPLNFFWRLIVRLLHVFDRGSRFGLRSEQIEGTDVTLEWTEAQVVRGQRVYIGAGCHIGLVEYTESAYVDPEASVKEVKQIL